MQEHREFVRVCGLAYHSRTRSTLNSCQAALNKHTVILPLLAMRPATVNWMESLAAPLPLFFHCSSLSLRIFILSASDILGSTSTLDFCWNIHSNREL